jgi:hypothetical protein
MVVLSPGRLRENGAANTPCPLPERERREKAKIEAAKERDRQAYRERGWPSG